MHVKKLLSMSYLILGCVMALFQNSSAQNNGILVYSKGSAGNRTLHLKRFTINNNQPTISSEEQKICNKGSIGGDIQSVISHDGKWVAFSRSLGGGSSFGGDDYHSFNKWDVYVVRIDGDLPAQPIKVAHGYWPSWGDDSDNPTKTLYYSKYEEKAIYKCKISENGEVSNITKHHSGFTSERDLHMQASPDGKKIAFREGGTVKILNIETGNKANANSGCHPSWCADSKWLIHANKVVVRHDGSRKKGGVGGDYHYGTSANLKWFVTRTQGNWQVQNNGNQCKLYNLSATETDFNISGGVTYTSSGSWVDVHEFDGPPAPSMRLSSESARIDMSASTTITATLNNFESTPEVQWSVSGGTIDPTTGTSVVFTPGEEGTFTITATAATLEETINITAFDPDRIHLMINCGGGDVDGWMGAGSYARGGESYDFGSAPGTAGLDNPAPGEVYQTVYHSAEGSHDYDFDDIPNGDFTLRLHFYDKHDGRTMAFSVEGENILEGYDPPGSPEIKEFDVTVKDGNGLQISCESAGGSDVFLSGIEIIANGTPSFIDRHQTNKLTHKPLNITQMGGTYTFNVSFTGAYQLDIISMNGATVRRFNGNGKSKMAWKPNAAAGVYLIYLVSEKQIMGKQTIMLR